MLYGSNVHTTTPMARILRTTTTTATATTMETTGIVSKQQSTVDNGNGAPCPEEIVARIEDVVIALLESVQHNELPKLQCHRFTRHFTPTQSRSFSSILMVLSFCHELLLDNKTTTTREVYYYFVTHFRNQRECDMAIWDAAELIGAPRICLGLTASPKGTFREDCLSVLELIAGMPFVSLAWISGRARVSVCVCVYERE